MHQCEALAQYGLADLGSRRHEIIDRSSPRECTTMRHALLSARYFARETRVLQPYKFRRSSAERPACIISRDVAPNSDTGCRQAI